MLDNNPPSSAERQARIFALAKDVWDSESIAWEFLNTGHSLLEGRTPLDVSLTEPGAQQVERLLWKIIYGIPV
jgi:putative toxin-antitoxin system antitoxin component (TIGR02293 family)